MIYYRAGEHFLDPVPKLALNFKEILSRAHRNFEEQNTVLEPSIIITDYFTTIIIITDYFTTIIIIINAYCDLQQNY
jgi:hypothetical protein